MMSGGNNPRDSQYLKVLGSWDALTSMLCGHFPTSSLDVARVAFKLWPRSAAADPHGAAPDMGAGCDLLLGLAYDAASAATLGSAFSSCSRLA